MLVIGITGLRGSGKSLAEEAGRELGYEVVQMRDVVVEMMKAEGSEIDNKTLRLYADELRKKHGKNFVAKKVCEKLKHLPQDGKVLVSGVRGLDEVNEITSHFPHFYLIGMFAPQWQRFERIKARGRPDDPKSLKDFVWSDELELSWGVGDSLAMSEFVVENTTTIGKAKEWLSQLFRHIEGKKRK